MRSILRAAGPWLFWFAVLAALTAAGVQNRGPKAFASNPRSLTAVPLPRTADGDCRGTTLLP